MDTQKILPRSEVPQELTWDLRDIFPSDEAWRAEYDALAIVAAVGRKMAYQPGSSGRPCARRFCPRPERRAAG